MIVDHSPATGLRLLEADDFKGFKLRLSGHADTRPAIDGVRFVDDGNVLIGIDRVPALPGAPDTAAWHEAYRAMIAYAAGKGWVDAGSNAIRAHVERWP
ncbi:hypothetical protein [Aquibium sp. ELW1220]|jgi:hypothetical protein|uniref:hypothetical protein n=1 Tax=Aquibium sp. ELW1220 TaxID=2976766 RepID=UPI0025B10E31|nr:hypothetical protein [Aquibium sp. ELW1220]MDN2582081.1 hypothetical protein [Aquibium sp. ELW1220]